MKNKCIILLLTTFFLSSISYSQVNYGVGNEVHHPVYAKNGMVASQDKTATEVGVAILENGGNAIDAAVAVGFTLAVTHPNAGNIGGGGFMLIRLKDGTTTSIDFREVAPKKAFRDMFLDKDGNVDNAKALASHLSSGVPGTVAGLLYALDKYGTQERPALINPAIDLAEKGIAVNLIVGKMLMRYGTDALGPHESSRAIFYNSDGELLKFNDQLVQKDLAKSLTLIRDKGRDGFYKGDTANKIAAQMEKNSGFITLEDLENYKVVERAPVTGTYKGYEIISMAPPSSGGIHIIQMLNILENFDLKKEGHNSANALHLITEAMKYAYADRSVYLGDPDFNTIPVNALMSKAYAKEIASKITPDKTTASSSIKPQDLTLYDEAKQTTHYSVADKEGNVVSVTYTLNTNWGSGIVAEGTGILLNNQMDDFSSKPGIPNVFGLVGGEFNSIAANKRPLSSMSPTIVSKDGAVFLVTGSQGGSRIITNVLQILLNTLEFDMNIAEATNAPRIHHQWLPDLLYVEKGINIDTINILKTKGHEVKDEELLLGSTQSIMRIKDGWYGSSDPRTQDDLSLGY